MLLGILALLGLPIGAYYTYKYARKAGDELTKAVLLNNPDVIKAALRYYAANPDKRDELVEHINNL